MQQSEIAQQIRALLDWATPGPWTVANYQPRPSVGVSNLRMVWGEGRRTMCIECVPVGTAEYLVAVSPTNIRILLDELDALTAALTQSDPTPLPAPVDGERQKPIANALNQKRQALTGILTAELIETYSCTRDWSAWSCGTMTEDDFEPAEERVGEIADSIMRGIFEDYSILDNVRASPQPAPEDAGDFVAGYDAGLKQGEADASITTRQAIAKAYAVLKIYQRGMLPPSVDVDSAVTAIELADLSASPLPSGTVGESVDVNLSDSLISDAIRSAYDRGYNDARNAYNTERDNAKGYRGRDKSQEISADLLARLRHIASPPSEPAPQVVATQITMGLGLVDVTQINHEGRAGILFRPREQHIPVGDEGELLPGEYWPVEGDVVIWIENEAGASVIAKYLEPFLDRVPRAGWTKVPEEPSLELLKSINIDNQVLAYENGRYYNAWFEFERSEGGWLWTDEADSEPNPSHYRPLGPIALSADADGKEG